ncbi:mandelate racemase/muconate lactonizing enzyme family protein [Pelagibius sp. CAU 1746]|uniref:mandelate racemase/muconate lactonizing enzyme family protein n=1 Tax=Pelagibius sp. CAU 1746 TaxID=3140370 RepID=UPI00325B34E4
MRLREVTLHRVDLPLTAPCCLPCGTFESLEPLLVEVRDEDGAVGWGEQHILPGSSAETREGGWAFARDLAEQVAGMETGQAKKRILARAGESRAAATALVTAIEMLEGAERLVNRRERRFRLPAAFDATGRGAIAEEVEQRLAQGFRTFKIEVGRNLAEDIRRLIWIQEELAGRATLRIDAKGAYSRAAGCCFAAAIDPEGVELFEQPCAAGDWQANAAVAAVSRVPLMLDESIRSLTDIDRAAAIEGIGFCKVKLKRFGSLAALEQAIGYLQAKGLAAVAGDGLGAEIDCWMEARVADGLIGKAGEFNGFLKIRPEARLLAEPLPFTAGEIVLPAGWWPEIDRQRLRLRCLQRHRFAAPRA